MSVGDDLNRILRIDRDAREGADIATFPQEHFAARMTEAMQTLRALGQMYASVQEHTDALVADLQELDFSEASSVRIDALENANHRFGQIYALLTPEVNRAQERLQRQKEQKLQTLKELDRLKCRLEELSETTPWEQGIVLVSRGANAYVLKRKEDAKKEKGKLMPTNKPT